MIKLINHLNFIHLNSKNVELFKEKLHIMNIIDKFLFLLYRFYSNN